MSTTTEDSPGRSYTVRRNAEGLTEREQELRALLAEGLSQIEIAQRMGVNKQRVSEIKLKLEREGKLEVPKPLELLSKSEWRALAAALRKFGADATTQPVKDAAVRALEKSRQLLPKGVSW